MTIHYTVNDLVTECGKKCRYWWVGEKTSTWSKVTCKSCLRTFRGKRAMLLQPKEQNMNQIDILIRNRDNVVALAARPYDREIERLLRIQQREAEALARFGEDDYENGAVILFDYQFYESTKVYSYACIK